MNYNYLFAVHHFCVSVMAVGELDMSSMMVCWHVGCWRVRRLSFAHFGHSELAIEHSKHFYLPIVLVKRFQ